MVTLGEVVMILELHRQGLKVSAIARQTGLDRKTIRKYIARGLEPPDLRPARAPSKKHRGVPAVSGRASRHFPGPDRRTALARVARARLWRRLYGGPLSGSLGRP